VQLEVLGKGQELVRSVSTTEVPPLMMLKGAKVKVHDFELETGVDQDELYLENNDAKTLLVGRSVACGFLPSSVMHTLQMLVMQGNVFRPPEGSMLFRSILLRMIIQRAGTAIS